MRRSTRTPPTSKPALTRRRLLAAGIEVSGAAAILGTLLPGSARAQSRAALTVADLGGLALIQGAGCNVTAMAGDDGALMIDGGLPEHAPALIAAVLEATGTDRIDTLINTHWHPEQTGANQLVGASGATIFAHEKTQMYLSRVSYAESFDQRREPLPEVARPNEVTRGDGTLEFAGRRIDFGYLPQAHTDGDLYLHFPDLGVLVAGGVVAGDRWPLLDYRNGAWFGGRVRALEWLAELVTPATQVVPAQGPLLDGTDIVRLRDIYQELFVTLIDYMNRGFGPEDAAANNPLAAYANEFGDASEFLYGAYRSMLIAYVPE